MYSARDLMINDIPIAKENQYLHEAYYAMLKNRVRHLPVVNDNDELVGIVSRIDILMHSSQDAEQASLHTPHVKVRKIMNEEVVTCTIDTSLADIAATMIACKIDCVPIVKNRKILGVVRSTDFLQLFQTGKLECAS